MAPRFDENSRMFANRRLTRRRALATGDGGVAAGLVTGLAMSSATPETTTAARTTSLVVGRPSASLGKFRTARNRIP